MRRLQLLSPLVLLLALAGCGGGAVHYYLIDPAPGPVLRAATGAPPLSLQIVDLEVPQYLERFQLVTRGSGNALDYAAAHQWGEPLRKTLVRVLATHLSTVLATPEVATPEARLASQPDLRLLVHVERFERGTDGRVVLHGRWQLTDAADGRVLVTERAQLDGGASVPEGDWPALVGAMQARFGEFAQRIAASVAGQVAQTEAQG